MLRLYLIVREDLSLAQQAVQAAHALQEFNIQYPEVARDWFHNSNTLAFLSVPTQDDLFQVAEKAKELGIEVSLNREPDIGNELTAIAVGPAGKRITRKIPLAMRGDSV